jgi:hypothetical protein
MADRVFSVRQPFSLASKPHAILVAFRLLVVDEFRFEPGPKNRWIYGPRCRSVCPEWGPVIPRFLAGTFDGTAEAVSKTGSFFGIPKKRLG